MLLLLLQPLAAVLVLVCLSWQCLPSCMQEGPFPACCGCGHLRLLLLLVVGTHWQSCVSWKHARVLHRCRCAGSLLLPLPLLYACWV